MSEGAMRGTGVTQEVTQERQIQAQAEFDVKVARALATHRHLWIAVLSHAMSDLTAREIAAGKAHTDVVFDMESLAVSSFGCFCCEQALSSALIGGRCPGMVE